MSSSPSVPNNSIFDLVNPLRIDAIQNMTDGTWTTAPVPDMIYHYCDGNALLGIVEGQTIRATDFRYCNDDREISHGLNALRQECRVLASGNPNAFKTNLLIRLEQDLQDEDRLTAFGCCLSEKPDQLSQWRGYADQGRGYCIGFDMRALIHALPGSGAFCKVIYDATTQAALCRSVIEALVNELNDLHNLHGHSEEDLLRYISPTVSAFATRFKDQGFGEEQEIRIVSAIDSELVRYQETKFRNRAGVMIPYREFKPPLGQKIPIQKVFIGPGLAGKRAEKSLRIFLDTNGYDSTEIEPSTIPYLP